MNSEKLTAEIIKLLVEKYGMGVRSVSEYSKDYKMLTLHDYDGASGEPYIAVMIDVRTELIEEPE